MPMYGSPPKPNPVPTTYSSRAMPSPYLPSGVPPDPAKFGTATGGATSVPALREGLFKSLYRMGRGMDNPGETALRGMGPQGIPVGGPPVDAGGLDGLNGGGGNPVGLPPVINPESAPNPIASPSTAGLPGFPQAPPDYAPAHTVRPPVMGQYPPATGSGIGPPNTGRPLPMDRIRRSGVVPGVPRIGGSPNVSRQSRLSKLMPVAPDGRRRY
jgi:hypothetical protein